MKLCLDTNAYSQLALGDNTSLRSCLELAVELFVPATVLGELYAGFSMGGNFTANAKLLATFLSLPGVSVAETTADVAERYGLLVASLRKAGTPLPTNDIWIAATTMNAGAKLVTYDQHFSRIPGLLTIAP